MLHKSYLLYRLELKHFFEDVILMLKNLMYIHCNISDIFFFLPLPFILGGNGKGDLVANKALN